MGQVESVNVALVRNGEWAGRIGRTGIDKRPVVGEVLLSPRGVAGDTVVDTRRHGGRDQAVCAFDLEDLDYWSAELGRELPPGSAGENLTVSGVQTHTAVVGERWRVGNAVVRVTAPRIPCPVLAAFWRVPDLVERVTALGRAGAYLAVEESGAVQGGDRVEVLDLPAHGVTVADLFAFRAAGRRERMGHIRRALPDLPERWRRYVCAAPGAAGGA
jgi:MOSC domain-containing protein YiiM